MNSAPRHYKKSLDFTCFEQSVAAQTPLPEFQKALLHGLGCFREYMLGKCSDGFGGAFIGGKQCIQHDTEMIDHRDISKHEV